MIVFVFSPEILVGCLAWPPHRDCLRNMLESTQYRFFRLAAYRIDDPMSTYNLGFSYNYNIIMLLRIIR